MQLSELVEHVKELGMRRYAVKRGFALPLALGASAVAATQHGLGTYRDTREKLDNASHQQLAPDVARRKVAANGGGKGGGGGGGNVGGAGTQWPFGGGGGAGTPAGPFSPSMSGYPMGTQMADAARAGAGSGLGALAGIPAAGLANGLGGVMNKGLDRLFFGRGEFGERKDPLHMLGSAAIGSFGKGLGDLGVQLLQDIASKAVAAAGNVGQNAARQAILQQLKQEDAILSNADDKVLMEAYHTMTRFAPVLSTDKNAVRSFLRQAVMSGSGADFSTIKHLADSERAVTGQDRK
jgi:hypothetical protein